MQNFRVQLKKNAWEVAIYSIISRYPRCSCALEHASTVWDQLSELRDESTYKGFFDHLRASQFLNFFFEAICTGLWDFHAGTLGSW